MELHAAVAALSALANESRLDIFRLLVPEGPEGLAAGEIGEKLGIRANAGSAFASLKKIRPTSDNAAVPVRRVPTTAQRQHLGDASAFL